MRFGFRRRRAAAPGRGTWAQIKYIFWVENCREGRAGGALIQISSVTITHYELTSPTWRALAPSFARVSLNRSLRASLRLTVTPDRHTKPPSVACLTNTTTRIQRGDSKFAPLRRKRSCPAELNSVNGRMTEWEWERGRCARSMEKRKGKRLSFNRRLPFCLL